MITHTKRFLFFFLLLLPFSLQAQQKVVVIELMEMISPASARHMIKGLEFAEEEKADLVLVHMNTYGGLVEDCDTIRARLLNLDVPTWVYIDKNAASAGAIISVACDSIFMSPGASIGAATVVDGSSGEALPDKYQSYWRGIIRATAEENGRDPKIAEKMIDQNLEIEGLSPKGQVITFTPEEAIENGYCEGVRHSVSEVLEMGGYENAEVVTYEPDFIDNIISFLLSPVVSGILIMLIVGGVWWEIKTPGLGVPSMVALVAGILYFAPHYLEGLAEYWEIGLFLVGVVLLAIEIFVTPGFGVAGILGILFMVTGLAVTLLNNVGLNFTMVPMLSVLEAFAMVFVALATSIVAVVWLVKRFVKVKRLNPIVDTNTQDKEEGWTSLDSTLKELVGKEAVASTDLKPSGFIEIEGRRLDARSEGGFLVAGTKVKILKLDSTVLVVREIKE